MFNIKEWGKQYYIDNKEHIKQYYIDNKEIILERNRQWRKNNPEKAKKISNRATKRYRENNLEKVRKCIKKWYQNNLEKVKIDHNQYSQSRYKIDLKFNLNRRIRGMIIYSLKGNKKGRHWETLVGYILEDLIKRLKSTMPEGYTWQDYLDGKLQIDHRIPISAFNFSKSEHTDFKRCWALQNLRLLPIKENLKKSNKLEKPFQPALKF